MSGFPNFENTLFRLNGTLDCILLQNEDIRSLVAEVRAHFRALNVPFPEPMMSVMAYLAADLGNSQQDDYLDALQLLAFSTAANIYPQLEEPLQELLEQYSADMGGATLLAYIMVAASAYWTPSAQF
jgi:hypothetical protein